MQRRMIGYLQKNVEMIKTKRYNHKIQNRRQAGHRGQDQTGGIAVGRKMMLSKAKLYR